MFVAIVKVEKIASIDRGWLRNGDIGMFLYGNVEKIASIDRGWLHKIAASPATKGPLWRK